MSSAKMVKFDEAVDVVQHPEDQTGKLSEMRPPSAVAGTTYEQVLEKMGVGEEDAEKPFWAKFLRTDYMD